MSKIEHPLSDKQKETLFKIFLTLPLCPKELHSKELAETLFLSLASIFRYLQFLLGLGIILKTKRDGGIYYYCRKGGKKELDRELLNLEK